MCYFLTAIVAPDTNQLHMERLAEAHGLGWTALEASPVVKRLNPGERYFLTTSGKCDCKTHIGFASRLPQRRDDTERIRKLERKGWSRAKIQRKLDASPYARATAQLNELKENGSEEVDRWLAFMAKAASATPHLGLLLHDYKGSAADEDVPFTKRTSLAQPTAADLLALETDHLYEFSLRG